MKRLGPIGWLALAVAVCVLVAMGLRSGHIQYMISDVLSF